MNISAVEVTFQGGFSAATVSIAPGKVAATPAAPPASSAAAAAGDGEVGDAAGGAAAATGGAAGSKLMFARGAPFAAADTHRAQLFSLTAAGAEALKLTLTNMSDTHGRVIIYAVNVYGEPVAEKSSSAAGVDLGGDIFDLAAMSASLPS